MRVSRWGDSLSIRLPDDLVREKGLKEGDEIEVSIVVARTEAPARRAAALADLKALRGIFPADYRFKRGDAYEDE